MGNVLCREKRASPRRVYTKGSGPTVYDQNISSSSQLANPSTKIETPNLSLMNSTITLDPRIFDNGLKTPIPPPRKKRGSTLRKGASLPPSSSIHSADSDSTGGGKSPDDLQSSTQSLPSRKLKVGNKKSDKILGESLSDHLSDEPIDSPSSRGSTAADEVDKSASLTISDKKLSFLLNMLEEEQKQKQSIAAAPLDSKQNEDEDDDDDEFYKNKAPVEEPLFVARKKVTRHICDDDEHIRDFIGSEKDREHYHSHDDHDHVSFNDPPAPKKPERDFSKYQQQNEVTTVAEIVKDVEHVTVAANDNVVKVRKTLSRENLPQPPEVPAQRRSTGANELISEAIVKVDEITVEKMDEVKKSPKSVNRTISLNLSEGQSSQHGEDLSPQTAPILTSKSIVDSFNFVPSCPDIHPVVKSDAAVVAVKKVVKFDTPPESQSSTSNDDDDDAITVRDADDVTPANSQMNSSMNTSMNEIIEEIYSRNSQIMKDFHSYLEPPPPAKTIEDLMGSKDDIDNKASTSLKTDSSEIMLRPTKSDDDENVQVIAVKSVETTTNNHHHHQHENNNNVDFVRHSGVSEQEAIEDDDDDKRRYSDSFESTDEDELDTERKPKSRKFNKNTTTLVSIQIKADDNNASDNDKKSTEAAIESFSDLPIFKSIVEETISNTREFIREKSPDHSTLLKLLNDKPSNSTSE